MIQLRYNISFPTTVQLHYQLTTINNCCSLLQDTSNVTRTAEMNFGTIGRFRLQCATICRRRTHDVQTTATASPQLGYVDAVSTVA